MRKGRIISVTASLVLMAAFAGAFFYRQSIQDWYRLRSYVPSAEIAKLADDATLNSNSRRLFYVQHPLLADKASFNEYCRENEQTIVLGCFIHNQGIYLLDVTDERLDGVEQVTAAHELLHAAYERLDNNERSRVDVLLQNVYESLNNVRLQETIELYREQNPSIIPNELHSIIGTEVRNLGSELETYYKRYFADRSKIVAYSEQYEQAFIERRNAIRDYDEQLTVFKGQIDGLQASLKVSSDDLASQRNLMNSLRNSGQVQGYNEEVPSYNQKVNQYNRDIDRLEALIVQYNNLVQTRNDIAAEEAELVEAIDSREIVPQQQ